MTALETEDAMTLEEKVAHAAKLTNQVLNRSPEHDKVEEEELTQMPQINIPDNPLMVNNWMTAQPTPRDGGSLLAGLVKIRPNNNK